MKRISYFLKRQSLNVMVTLTIALGLFTFVQAPKAKPSIWCPPCSSDFAQHNKCEFLYWVGGNCYCCVTVE